MARFKIGHSFCLDDREFKILSGAIHYFRVQPEDWYHSLYNLKALGFNTVETYLPWNMHEPQKGVFDFQGILDIEAFLQIAQALGLYAIIRPSPFICAEWQFGGLPAWQLNTDGVYPIAADGLPEKKADAERDFVKKLTKGAALKEIFAATDEQIQLVSGLDHPFALSPSRNQAGTLYHPASGRRLTIETQAPCLVIYSANCVDDSVQFDGQPMIQHNGLALEAQALPDAIHSSQQSDVILKAGQIFTSRTVYFADVPATL